MTELELRNRVVSCAEKYLGCRESDGSHRKIIDLYNSRRPLARGYAMRYTDPWCAAFVSAVAIELGLTDICPTECSCSKLMALYQTMGRWKERDDFVPSPGDIVIYDWDDGADYAKTDDKNAPDHTGIVISCDGKTMRVIEGNKNDAVAYRTLSVNGRYIRGFCCPDYAQKADRKKSDDEIAREVIDGRWGNGAARKKALAAAGYDPAAVQAIVNRLLQKPAAWTPEVGDTVFYSGSVHYRSAGSTDAVKCRGGMAKITRIYLPGRAKHPYHLVRLSGSGATVYGWVDSGTFTKV